MLGLRVQHVGQGAVVDRFDVPLVSRRRLGPLQPGRHRLRLGGPGHLDVANHHLGRPQNAEVQRRSRRPPPPGPRPPPAAPSSGLPRATASGRRASCARARRPPAAPDRPRCCAARRRSGPRTACASTTAMLAGRAAGSFSSICITTAAICSGMLVVAHPLRQRRRRLLDVFGERAEIAGSAEGHLAGQRLVGQHAHRVDVGPVIVGRAQEALRRHVLRGPRDPVVAGGVPHQARHPEVDQLHQIGAPPAGEQHDVVRLEVQVDDPLLVRRLQALGDLAEDRQGAGRRQRPGAAQHAAERRPVEVLHHEEDPPIRDLTEVGHVADERAADAGRGPGLVAQAIDRVRTFPRSGRSTLSATLFSRAMCSAA